MKLIMSEVAPLSTLPLFAGTEEDAKREAFASMEETRAYYLDKVRRKMRALALVRMGQGLHPRATPDEARAAFEEMNPPAEMSRSFLALVFRGPEWKMAGRYKSATPGSHANVLHVYELVK